MASSSCVLSETHRLSAPERVMTELTRGREIANRLRLMLRETGCDGSAFPAQSLVNQVLDSFTHSLTMLRDNGDSDEVSQLHSAVAAGSEHSGDSCKTPPPPPKDRRGCYKRKRNSETVIKETSNLFEDGHAWRKYGQKVILNAKHPRNYFRCTHKYEQGCQASKQVQKVQDSPPLYRTTYNGHHTCSTITNTLLLKPSSISSSIFQESLTPDSSVIWNFTNLPPDSSIKQEIKEDQLVHQNIIQSPSSSSHSVDQDYYVTPDLTPSEHDELMAFSLAADVMASDAYSYPPSPHTTIEHVFHFETL